MDIYQPISLTATATLDRDTHAGTVCVLNAAGGATITLPASAGKGDVYEFIVGTTLTTSSYVVAANGTDVVAGIVMVATDTGGLTVPTSATSDKITMNGSTTGGVVGSRVKLTDFKSGTWQVSGELISTGAEATPFSAS